MSGSVPPARQCTMATCQREVPADGGAGELCEYHRTQLPGAKASDSSDSSESSTEEAEETDHGQSSSLAFEPTGLPDLDTGRLAEHIDLNDIETDTYPQDLVENGARWLLWQDSDGRKVPRNPRWGRTDQDDGYAFVGAKNPDAWFEFDKARDWATHEPDLELAYYLTGPDRTDWDDDPSYESVAPAQDVPEEPHVGLLDFDDVRDPETGDVAPEAIRLLDQVAGTFCEWSPSGTGVHALW